MEKAWIFNALGGLEKGSSVVLGKAVYYAFALVGAVTSYCALPAIGDSDRGCRRGSKDKAYPAP